MMHSRRATAYDVSRHERRQSSQPELRSFRLRRAELPRLNDRDGIRQYGVFEDGTRAVPMHNRVLDGDAGHVSGQERSEEPRSFLHRCPSCGVALSALAAVQPARATVGKVGAWRVSDEKVGTYGCDGLQRLR